MAPTAPSFKTWTIKLRNQKSTVVIHADPMQSIDSIKEELMRALLETLPESLPEHARSVDKASSIILARPIDTNDLEKGWTRLQGEERNTGSGAGSRPKKSKSDSEDAAGEHVSLKATGLRDGSSLAYRFIDGENADDGEGWDVVIPSYSEDMEE